MSNSPLKIVLLFGALFFFTSPANARIGVGVNTGKIEVSQDLKAGMIYQLPPITIINTGDESSEYRAGVTYHQSQPELRPDIKWFSFEPNKFYLEPGKGQLVNIKINLPFKIEPGNYFAYLEGRPIAIAQKGTTSIGVAAASKLYFRVTPANYLYAIYYKLASIFQIYSPWPQRLSIILVGLFVLFLFKKFFNIQVNFKKGHQSNQSDKQDE